MVVFWRSLPGVSADLALDCRRLKLCLEHSLCSMLMKFIKIFGGLPFYENSVSHWYFNRQNVCYFFTWHSCGYECAGHGTYRCEGDACCQCAGRGRICGHGR